MNSKVPAEMKEKKERTLHGDPNSFLKQKKKGDKGIWRNR